MSSGSIIVVKIGTSTLTDSTGKIDRTELDRLVSEMSLLAKQNHQIVVVSSGAIGSGAERLGRVGAIKTLPEKQAAAAVGQVLLMEAYQQSFGRFGITVAQILLTRDAISNRERHQNARSTVHKLLAMNVVPIVNENDTVAVEEIRVGDNDNLSALVAGLMDADLLVNLTTTDGFYIPQGDGTLQLVHTVHGLTEEHRLAAKLPKTGLGVGGMRTKLEAAEHCMKIGIPMVIASGKTPGVLARVVAGEKIGTRFVSRDVKQKGRKRRAT